MGAAVFAHGDAAVGGDDLDVEVAVGDGLADLLPGPAGGEHGEGAGKGDLAAQGQAGGGAHQVLLGDAHVEEAVLEDLGEVIGLGGAGQVGVQDDDVGVLFPQLGQGLAVFDAGAFFGGQGFSLF